MNLVPNQGLAEPGTLVKANFLSKDKNLISHFCGILPLKIKMAQYIGTDSDKGIAKYAIQTS